MTARELECPNCGAALTSVSLASDYVMCAYCGTHVPMFREERGGLVLGADFSRQPLPGWELLNPGQVRLQPGTPPELRAAFPASEQVHHVLRTSGVFDDIDASVSVRFLKGDVTYIRAGLFLRLRDGLGYGVLISAQATYLVGWYEADGDRKKWHSLLSWTTHQALRPGLDQVNRLRVVTRGTQLRIFLNDVLATSFRDERYRLGEVRLSVEPSNKSDIEAAFTQLELRETPTD